MCEICDRIHDLRDEGVQLYCSMILSEAPQLLSAVSNFLLDGDHIKLIYLIEQRLGKETHRGICQWADQQVASQIGLTVMGALEPEDLQLFCERVPPKFPQLKTPAGIHRELLRGGPHCKALADDLVKFRQVMETARHIQGSLQQMLRKPSPPKPTPESLLN
jgi:hypothetical protein